MKHILLIEDEELVSNLLSKKLQEEGYSVTTAGDGKTGLEKIEEEQPDLVLLDIILPKLTGIEVLEALQAKRLTGRIPVIIISNSGQPVELEKAKALGAVDWLVKTEFDPRQVVEKVNNYINTH